MFSFSFCCLEIIPRWGWRKVIADDACSDLLCVTVCFTLLTCMLLLLHVTLFRFLSQIFPMFKPQYFFILTCVYYIHSTHKACVITHPYAVVLTFITHAWLACFSPLADVLKGKCHFLWKHLGAGGQEYRNFKGRLWNRHIKMGPMSPVALSLSPTFMWKVLRFAVMFRRFEQNSRGFRKEPWNFCRPPLDWKDQSRICQIWGEFEMFKDGGGAGKWL